jgi:hypothetical protein
MASVTNPKSNRRRERIGMRRTVLLLTVILLQKGNHGTFEADSAPYTIALNSGMFLRRAHEAYEQGMGMHGTREELRMELRTEHKGVINNFGDFHQFPIWRKPREDHTGLFKGGAIGVIELEGIL